LQKRHRRFTEAQRPAGMIRAAAPDFRWPSPNRKRKERTMLTPEFLAASMIALGITHLRHGLAARVARETGERAVRSRRGRRLRKRGVPPEEPRGGASARNTRSA
jgi:hypothetical protein